MDKARFMKQIVLIFSIVLLATSLMTAEKVKPSPVKLSSEVQQEKMSSSCKHGSNTMAFIMAKLMVYMAGGRTGPYATFKVNMV